MKPRWWYAQARLQARHGARVSEGEWGTLAAARGPALYLDGLRATSLRAFAAHLHIDMSSHEVERLLRGAWRAYVAEVADWSEPAWRAALLWMALLPDLRLIEGLLRGAPAPTWVAVDPALAELDRGLAAALTVANNRSGSISARWTAHWRSMWPSADCAEADALNSLAGLVGAHFGDEANAASGARLERLALRAFRARAGGPSAAVCHVLLMAIDFERMRGGLLRRLLFASTPASDAA